MLAEDLPGARRCGVTTSSPQLPSEGFSSETKRLEPGQDQLGVMSAEGGAVCSNCRWLRDAFTFLLDLGTKFQTIDCGKKQDSDPTAFCFREPLSVRRPHVMQLPPGNEASAGALPLLKQRPPGPQRNPQGETGTFLQGTWTWASDAHGQV